MIEKSGVERAREALKAKGLELEEVDRRLWLALVEETARGADAQTRVADALEQIAEQFDRLAATAFPIHVKID